MYPLLLFFAALLVLDSWAGALSNFQVCCVWYIILIDILLRLGPFLCVPFRSPFERVRMRLNTNSDTDLGSKDSKLDSLQNKTTIGDVTFRDA